jgi:hypothetical protein
VLRYSTPASGQTRGHMFGLISQVPRQWRISESGLQCLYEGRAVSVLRSFGVSAATLSGVWSHLSFPFLLFPLSHHCRLISSSHHLHSRHGGR